VPNKRMDKRRSREVGRREAEKSATKLASGDWGNVRLQYPGQEGWCEAASCDVTLSVECS
jgi:hypothetical protein